MMHFLRFLPIFTIVSKIEALIFFPHSIGIGDGVGKSVVRDSRVVSVILVCISMFSLASALGLETFTHILMEAMSLLRPYKFNLLTGSTRHILPSTRSSKFEANSACCRAPKNNTRF